MFLEKKVGGRRKETFYDTYKTFICDEITPFGSVTTDTVSRVDTPSEKQKETILDLTNQLATATRLSADHFTAAGHYELLSAPFNVESAVNSVSST